MTHELHCAWATCHDLAPNISPSGLSLSQQVHIITNSLLVPGETINCTKRNNSMIRLDIKNYLPTTCQFHLVWHSLQLNKQIRKHFIITKNHPGHFLSHNVVPTFESVDEYYTEKYSARSCSAINYAVQGSSNV